MPPSPHQLEGGAAMKFFFVATVLLRPIQAFAQPVPSVPVPEPLSVGLLAVGLAGVGVAELIRRRRDK